MIDNTIRYWKCRSSRPEVFCKKGVLRNFAKFTGKHMRQSHFFNKIAGLRAATLLKKRLWHRCFPVNFSKFLRTPFSIEHLRWLLLKSISNLLIKTTKDDFYTLLRFYFFKREAYAKQNKNADTAENTVTQHTVLQQHKQHSRGVLIKRVLKICSKSHFGIGVFL